MPISLTSGISNVFGRINRKPVVAFKDGRGFLNVSVVLFRRTIS